MELRQSQIASFEASITDPRFDARRTARAMRPKESYLPLLLQALTEKEEIAQFNAMQVFGVWRWDDPRILAALEWVVKNHWSQALRVEAESILTRIIETPRHLAAKRRAAIEDCAVKFDNLDIDESLLAPIPSFSVKARALAKLYLEEYRSWEGVHIVFTRRSSGGRPNLGSQCAYWRCSDKGLELVDGVYLGGERPEVSFCLSWSGRSMFESVKAGGRAGHGTKFTLSWHRTPGGRLFPFRETRGRSWIS